MESLTPVPDRNQSLLRGYRTLRLAPAPTPTPTKAATTARKSALAVPTAAGSKRLPLRQPAPPRTPTAPERMTLFADDRLLAVASEGRVRVFDADQSGDEATPVAEVKVKSELELLVELEGELLGVAADGQAWRISALSDKKPSVTKLDGFGGPVRSVVPTRAGIVAVVDGGDAPELVSFERSRGVLRRAALPFTRIATVSALDDSGTVVVVDERHGAHVVRFDPTSDAGHVETVALDPAARVTAIAEGPAGLHYIARKGGELRTMELAPGHREPDDVCRRLRDLLKEHGCGCDESGTGTGDTRPEEPGRGKPAPQPGDDECKRRHRAQLRWNVGQLARVGSDLIAVSMRGDRFAVLDAKLNLLFERKMRGATIALGSPGTDRFAVLNRRGDVEYWRLSDYLDATGIRPLPTEAELLPAPTAETAVFYGQNKTPGSPNPHLRIAVFPVMEPGQVWGDPDQSRLNALMQTHAYSIAQDYFYENSFETLTPEFESIGVHLAGTGVPLTLPAPFASYFWDDFRAGGIQAVMPAAWPTPVTFDGREALTLRTHPSKGSSRDYPLSFAALWTRQLYPSFPVAVSFAGTETLAVTVTTPDGTAHTLTLAFGALNQSLTQGGDEATFLSALGAHVTTAIRTAETAAGSGRVLEDVVFRRIRTSDNNAEFGGLQAQWRVSGSGSGKGAVEIVAPGGTVPAGIAALGFAGSGSIRRSGSLTTSAAIHSYLIECLFATIRDAGEGPGASASHLLNTPTTTEDPAAQTVTVVIRLTDEYGGSSAKIERVSSSGLGATGWSSASAQPGSDTNFNNRNTLRHGDKLAHDTFTAGMNRIRSLGPWNREAVRNQFASYDAMMIAFVGSCPATVPAADRWHCTDPVGLGRFRMFVRYPYATDKNDPDPNATPVAMAANLVIGQRFDRFDAAVMNHEIGHGLGLPDLYKATGFRDDVRYVDDWCNMAGKNERFNHLCAWAKWSVGWIPESPIAAINRVINVPMPSPTRVSVTEAWLVPVEFWDNAMRADVTAAVGSGLPIGQMMKVHLGSDGGVFDIVEFRDSGARFSQNLAPVPSVVVTNVLDPNTDRRWAVNGLYRRSVHLLNRGTELTAPGDRWDFAAGAEFPLKGCVAEVVDIRFVRGGTIPICRLRIEREAAEYVDLYFDDPVPSWTSPDIWVDWRGDNPNPDEPRIYPEGTPTDQGEKVRYPSSGSEPHFVVARPHNDGNVHVENVRVKWFACDPPGAGDNGRWKERDTRTLPHLNAGDWAAVAFPWNVTPDVNSHQCLRAEIIDWRIPAAVDPATGDTVALAGDDVKLQNNLAQKNVFNFEVAT